jgi:hypothetical protein
VTRGRIVQTLADLVGFAQGVATRIGVSKSVEVQLAATDDDATDKWCELWGHAPLLYKPVDGAEQLYVELGDERVVFATKDRRWQIETGDGEVVLRAMGSGSPAYLKLKPDGTAELHATSIKLGGAADKRISLDELTRAAIADAILNHTHTGVTPGSGASGTGALTGVVASTASSKVEAE